MAPKPGTKFSALTRKRMRKAHLGKKHSEETKAKMRAAAQERVALIEAGLMPRFRHSEETKRKLRLIAKKQKRKPSKKALKLALQARRNKAANEKEIETITRKVLN